MAGTRFELVLRSHEGAERALYDATVHHDGATWTASVEITPGGARMVAGGEGMDPAVAKQLEALAKTLGRHVDADSPWPRRIARWRQPGVR